MHTGVYLTVNPARAGGAYGYVDMGDWTGSQAEYMLVPYADFNLLKLPNRDKPWKIHSTQTFKRASQASSSGG